MSDHLFVISTLSARIWELKRGVPTIRKSGAQFEDQINGDQINGPILRRFMSSVFTRGAVDGPGVGEAVDGVLRLMGFI